MSSYAYPPLSLAPHAIRLLRLLPHHDKADEIHCELFEYSLEGFHLYRYDALSYVWGNPDETLPVHIDGHRFNVTTNLHAALSRLRHRTFARLLWIDAICINQENQTEKGQQIQYMTTIYSHANCVIVWLGEAADDSDLACEKIRSAASIPETDSDSSDTDSWQIYDDSSDDADDDDDGGGGDDDEETARAECQLLKRTWFRRIWVS